MSNIWRKLGVGSKTRCRGNVWVGDEDPKDTRTHRGVIEGAMMGKDLMGVEKNKGVGKGAIYKVFIING